MDQEEIDYSYSLYIASLLYKELEKEWLTEKEREDLTAWTNENDEHAKTYLALQDRNRLASEVMELAKYDTPAATKEVMGRLGIKSGATIRPIRRWTVAAAVLILLLGSAVLFTIKERRPAVFARQPEIPPGGNKAVLTLADGSRIVLDSARNGQIAQQQSTVISRQNGQLIYGVQSGSSATGSAAAVGYNMMTTPRGGQFTVVLPDGSKALLNAASSLRYPTAFTGNDRTVELSGEAYFDIVKNKSQPFIVRTHDLDIKVLGTDFDVMAYTDEPGERATLVDGSVQVDMGSQTRVLAPGQQALAGNGAAGNAAGGAGLSIATADIDKETAWTTGFFKFDHTDIRTIMREISRWYDIEVTFEAKMNDSDTYSGRISRNLPLSDLISFLESNGVHHFRIEGRKLTVLA